MTTENPPTVLVVDGIPSTRTTTVGELSRAGYVCASAGSFRDAEARLAERSPDLLITAVRLGAFNGLQLVLQRFLRDPSRRAIVTDIVHDPVLEREARRAGAVYTVTPVSPQICSGSSRTSYGVSVATTIVAGHGPIRARGYSLPSMRRRPSSWMSATEAVGLS